MSNRYFYKNVYTLETDLVHLFGNFVVGASGAVGTAKGGGLSKPVKEITDGQYTLKWTDKYARFFGGQVGCLHTTASGIANVQFIGTPATFQADLKANKAVVIQCYDFAGAAVNPPSGSVISFRLDFRISSIGRYDSVALA